jgi:hypothetical protein
LNLGGGTFDQALLSLPDASIFAASNMGVLSPGVNGFTLNEITKFYDSYTAGSKLNAGYLMFDNRFKKFRLVWGLRVEDFTQTLNSRLTATEDLNLDTNKVDYLPSANLIYSINNSQNLRLSYSKTLNRPEYRELAPFGFYDFTNQFFTQGNSELKRATVQNYDIRYEIYPSKGQMFTVSYFMKQFKDPIEVINKYRRRGFTTILNDKERIKMIKYSHDIEKWRDLYEIKTLSKNNTDRLFKPLDLNNKLFKPAKNITHPGLYFNKTLYNIHHKSIINEYGYVNQLNKNELLMTLQKY